MHTAPRVRFLICRFSTKAGNIRNTLLFEVYICKHLDSFIQSCCKCDQTSPGEAWTWGCHPTCGWLGLCSQVKSLNPHQNVWIWRISPAHFPGQMNRGERGVIMCFEECNVHLSTVLHVRST